MPLSRSLLLKGLGGLTAASAAAIGGYGIMKPNDFSDLFKSKKAIEGEKKNKSDEINKKLKALGLSEEVCKLENSDFSNTTEYSKECELDKDKFKKIKFSNAGDADVEVEGWTGENKIKLSISNKSNGGIRFLFSGHPSNLTISKSSQDQTDKISIRSGREIEFKEEDGKLVKLVNQSLKDKLDGINKKMVGAGLPAGCSFDVTEEDKELECGLDGDKLKAIKFSNKGTGDLTVNGTVGNNLKIKVELGDNNDPSFSFTGLSEDLTILGESNKGKIVIKKEGDRKFRVSGEKLEKVSLNDRTLSTKLEKFNKQLSTLSLPNDCRFDVAEKDKVLECGLDADKLKKINFSNKGTPDLTLSGEIQGTLKVKVEAKDNEDEATFSFTGLTQDLSIYGDNKAKIVLKSSSATPARTFKNKNGKLEKVPQDPAKVGKLKGINKELEDLKIQDKCRFDVNDEDTSFECELSLDEFKAIKLTSKGDEEELTISSTTGYTGFQKAKLKVEMNTDTDDEEEEESKAIYTLSDLDQKIKFGKEGEEIILVPKKSYEFEVRKGKLGPKRLVAGSVGMGTALFVNSCTYDGNSNKGTCKSPSGFINMVFDDSGTEVSTSVTWTDNAKQETFNFWEYQEGYAEGIKFTYTGTTHSTKVKSQERKLEQNKDYELKKNVDGEWALKEKP